MRVFIRPAALTDIRQMAEIAGTGVFARDLAEWMDGDSAYAAWHLIESNDGRILGFQHIGRTEALPAEACEIATFFAPGPLPPGAATRLFEATAEAARLLGYAWISAEPTAPNEAARIYYQNQGFRPRKVTLTHLKLRFDLD